MDTTTTEAKLMLALARVEEQAKDYAASIAAITAEKDEAIKAAATEKQEAITKEEEAHKAATAALKAEHAEALKAKDAELATAKQAFSELSAYKDAMEKQVSTVLQGGDPAQYEALARDFLTPAQEKQRQATLAKIQALKAEAATLEASLLTD
jgi:hypothetical protein